MSSAMALDSGIGFSRKRGPSPSRDDSLPPRDAPLSKRFRGLTLRGNHFRDRITKNSNQRRSSPAAESIRTRLQDAGSDFMQMDDSPNKVYIFDLDEEAKSDSERDENEDDEGAKSSMVFLPDIDKKFNKIPLSVLKAGSSENKSQQPAPASSSTEVILYRDPALLIVPAAEQESVRKLILQAREQARQKVAQEVMAQPSPPQSSLVTPVQLTPTASSFYGYQGVSGISNFEADPDAMDMD